MKLNRVLVIYKRHVTGIEGVATEFVPLKGELSGRQRLQDEAVSFVKDELTQRGICFDLIDRDDLRPGFEGDLIIAIGGDGTILSAAHAAGAIPILGLNSMPGHSVGFFCSANIGNFGKRLHDIADDKTHPKLLPLIEASINSSPLEILALNELLFAGATPAETVRYEITVEGRSERQRSSGIWIAAGPGSTAVIRSAGGRKLPVESTNLQFVVREPCLSPEKKYELVKGVLKSGEGVSVVSEMIDCCVYIDGAKVSYPVKYGARLSAKIAKEYLKIFI